MKRTQFAVIIPVGPGKVEMERLKDTLASLEFYEAENFHLIIVDDDPSQHRFQEHAVDLPKDRTTLITNPRNGRGDGWAAGCMAAVLAGLKELVRQKIEVDFILKLDTDALVIRSFADQISRYFQEHPSAGMIGSIIRDNGSPALREALRSMGKALDKLVKQFTIWRRTPVGGLSIQIALYGNYRKIRDVIRQGLINGFSFDEFCRGGSYALSSACLQAFLRNGLLENPLLWLATPVTEDIGISLCVKSVDLDFSGFDDPGEPFAIHYLRLPGTPEELLQRGFGIIHSVKDCNEQKEAAVRTFFHEIRLQGVKIAARFPTSNLMKDSANERHRDQNRSVKNHQ
jgi:hypothetical protein